MRRGGQPPLQVRGQAVRRHHVEAGARQQHHAAIARVRGLRRAGLEHRHLARDVEVVRAGCAGTPPPSAPTCARTAPRSAARRCVPAASASSAAASSSATARCSRASSRASAATASALRPASTGRSPRARRLARDQLARVAVRAVDHPVRRRGHAFKPINARCCAPAGSGTQPVVPDRRCKSLQTKYLNGMLVSSHGGTISLHGDDLVRPGHRPHPALLRERDVGGRLLQHAAREVQLAAAPAVHLPEGRGDRHPRPDGQGLRVRQGPVRDVHRGRDQVDGRGVEQDHRDRRVRPHLQGRPHLLRGSLLPRARQGRREGLQAPHRGHAADGALRARQLGRPRQGLPGAAAPGGQGPRHAGAPLRRRGALLRRGAGGRRGGAGRGDEARGAAHRADRRRGVPPRELPGRGAQAVPRGHPAQGRGPGGHVRRARAAARPDHRPHGRAEGQPGRARRPRNPPPPRPRRPRREAAANGRRKSEDQKPARASVVARPPPRAAAAPPRDSLARVARDVVGCERCPRLRAWCREVARVKVRRFQDQEYWGRPLPGWGDPRARLFVIGLAPAAHGGNRTGRIFTGDRSGDFLFAALHRAGFANQPTSIARGDGLELRDCYIAAVARCAPPANKPLPEEIGRCREYLVREWGLLQPRAVLALGRIAQDGLVAMLRSIGRVPPRGTRSPSATASRPTSATGCGCSAASTRRSRTPSPGSSPRPTWTAS